MGPALVLDLFFGAGPFKQQRLSSCSRRSSSKGEGEGEGDDQSENSLMLMDSGEDEDEDKEGNGDGEEDEDNEIAPRTAQAAAWAADALVRLMVSQERDEPSRRAVPTALLAYIDSTGAGAGAGTGTSSNAHPTIASHAAAGMAACLLSRILEVLHSPSSSVRSDMTL